MVLTAISLLDIFLVTFMVRIFLCWDDISVMRCTKLHPSALCRAKGEFFRTKDKLKLKRRGRVFLPKFPHSLNLLTRVLHLWTLDVMMGGFGKHPSSSNLNQWHHFLRNCPMMTEKFMKISPSHTPVRNERGCWNYEGFKHNDEALFSKGVLCLSFLSIYNSC